jgi:sugar lactone lactonase YvrE
MRTKILLPVILFFCGLNSFAQTVSDFVSVPNPDDMEVDSSGNLWVNYRVSLSSPEHRLAKITPDGTLTDVITENHTLGQFGVNDNTIWIAGEWGATSKIYKYDHSGNKLDSIPMPYPTAIILDPDDTWYVTQNALGRLTKVNPDKTTQILASGSPLNYNLALARDENGMFYTCNLMDAKVIKIDPTTGVKTTLLTLPVLATYNLGFLTYRDGYLYVPGYGSHCIYKVDTAGTGYTIIAGTEGSPGDVNGAALTAKFDTPTSVYFSQSGDTLFVADSKNNKIKAISGMNGSMSVAENVENASDVFVYPNPVVENLQIELQKNGESIKTIDIIGMDGKLVKHLKLNNTSGLNQYKISVTNLTQGNYILNITTSKGKVISKKFIKG